VISDLINWLKESNGYQNSNTYQTIRAHYDEGDSRSIAVRLLIHYMGDIHQPLHCLERVDTNYSSGDRGGNEFPLKYHYDVDELHALWDTVIYENHNSVSLVSLNP
jgi:hypothetical protein